MGVSPLFGADETASAPVGAALAMPKATAAPKIVSRIDFITLSFIINLMYIIM